MKALIIGFIILCAFTMYLLFKVAFLKSDMEFEIKHLTSELEKEAKNRKILSRIILNAKENEPTFSKTVIRKDYETRKNHYGSRDEFWVYLYIYKTEFQIHLKEFDDTTVVYCPNSYFDLKVDGGLAYFTYDHPKNSYIEQFIIDYMKGTYIVKTIEKERKETYECTNC